VRWRRIDHFLNIQLELFKPLFKRYRKSCIEALRQNKAGGSQELLVKFRKIICNDFW
jgi:hypothetical protein